MKLVKLNSTQFDKYVSTHKYRNYYQTSMYANLMIKFGYRSQFLGITNDQNKLIGATLILYKEIFMKNKIAYAPRGILFNYENQTDLENLTEKIKKVLGKQGFMLLRIDPSVPLTIRDQNGNIMNINSKGNIIIENLIKAGFKYKGKNLYFETEKPRWEGLVILQKTTSELFENLDTKTRNRIRRANNIGIEVIKDENNNIEKLYEFVKDKEKKPLSYYKAICEAYKENVDIYYAKVQTRTFLINSKKNYTEELEYNEMLSKRIESMNLSNEDRLDCLNNKMESDKLIAAYKNSLETATNLLRNNPDGIIISGVLVIKYDNAAYIVVEGQDERYLFLNPLYLIKWQLIADYNNQGLKYLNLNKISGNFENTNKYGDLNESKLGFNTTVTEYIGEFDLILNNITYNLYKKMNKEKSKE